MASFFDVSSPFVEYCTQATCAVFLKEIHAFITVYHITAMEAVGQLALVPLPQFLIIFAQEIVTYTRQCCDEYLAISNSNPPVDLDENNIKHYVYAKFQEIINSSNDTNSGYKHLNCIFDGVINYCVVQAEYVYNYLPEHGLPMGGTHSHLAGHYSNAVATVIREYLTMTLKDSIQNITDEARSNGKPKECSTDDI